MGWWRLEHHLPIDRRDKSTRSASLAYSSPASKEIGVCAAWLNNGHRAANNVSDSDRSSLDYDTTYQRRASPAAVRLVWVSRRYRSRVKDVEKATRSEKQRPKSNNKATNNAPIIGLFRTDYMFIIFVFHYLSFSIWFVVYIRCSDVIIVQLRTKHAAMLEQHLMWKRSEFNCGIWKFLSQGYLQTVSFDNNCQSYNNNL